MMPQITRHEAMIGELGKEAQMICTTFRPEMLEHADLFLGVIFNNRKISTIQEIEKTHAKQFVESLSYFHSSGSLSSLVRYARGSDVVACCG